MKNKYIKVVALLLSTCAILSCKKELNVFPSTQQVDGNVILDTKSAAAVLNGVYYRFADAGKDNNEVPSTIWTQSHETTPSELSGLLTYSTGGDSFESFSFTELDPAISANWTYGYNLVNAANGFLKNVEPVKSIPAAIKTQMKAEALFLRAFANAELLFYYGQYQDLNSKYGIVLRDEFVTSKNLSIGRSTVAESYDSILADLDAAIAGLPQLNTKLFYANVWVAKQLKARVLLNRGKAGDYAEVISLTSNIIAESPFALEAQLKDIFLSKGFSSKEVMLSVQPFPTESFKFMQNQYYIEYCGTKDAASLFLNDPRADWYFKLVEQRGAFYPSLTKYYSGSVTDIALTPLSVNCYAFRLTEAYLMEAEAIALSGGDLTKAKTLLKTVMGNAGLTDFSAVDAANTGADLQLQIVKEVMKNFLGENGLDWFALRRLPFATIQTLRSGLKSPNSLVLPIPYAERSANSKIEQTPGY